MLNVFIDVCANLRLAVIKNGNAVLVQTFDINDYTMQNVLERLNGIKIDHLIFSIAGFYYKKVIKQAYTPLKVRIGNEEYFCNFDKNDLDYLLKLKKKLKCNDVRFFERTGFIITLAQKNSVNYETFGRYTQFYVADDNGGRFYYSYNKNQDKALIALKQENENYVTYETDKISNQKLLSYIKNKNLIKTSDMLSIKNFLSLCLFLLSNMAKDYMFECDEAALQDFEVSDGSASDIQKVHTINKAEDIKETASIRKSDSPKSKLKKVYPEGDNKITKSHTNNREYLLKYLFLVVVFLNMCFIGVSIFCQRDVVALTKQSSQMVAELNTLNNKTQLLKDANTKKIEMEKIETIEEILGLKLKASLGEITLDWDNNLSILLYIESLEQAESYKILLSEFSQDIEYDSEGTIIINNKLWYKIRFTLEPEA